VLHPHQEVVLAPEEMCVSIPDAVPTQRAVLAANMETALNLMWDAAPLAGCAMAVAEALTRGLLIAATAGGEPASLVPIAAGIISSPGDPEHLSKPLRQVIPGAAPRRQMANVACAAGRALAS
jgi:hypothetical protein